ncbi:MAG: nucleotidyltransferase domain-containing protein [Spirochaetes bacterium]|nr:MAG: nucleotidyltransferase domain-containing protein [Spirochaetota bacterium]
MAPVDISKVKSFLAEKEKKRERQLKERLKKAHADFLSIVRMIIDKYNPRKIYQWGSLIHSEHFSELSDIDIALEGISSVEQLFQLYGDAMKMTDFPLDIVEIEKLEPEFRKIIIEHGKLIYEREDKNIGSD